LQELSLLLDLLLLVDNLGPDLGLEGNKVVWVAYELAVCIARRINRQAIDEIAHVNCALVLDLELKSL